MTREPSSFNLQLTALKLLIYLSHSKALLFHSSNNPRLRINTRITKTQATEVDPIGEAIKGTTRISSMSNTTKITAKIKNRRDTGWRKSVAVENPHSRGEIISRLAKLIFLKINPRLIKTTLRAVPTKIHLPHINIYIKTLGARTTRETRRVAE